MNPDTRSVVEAHWQLANSRNWATFAALLHPALHYDVPQTREYIESGTGYLEMVRTWPEPYEPPVRHTPHMQRRPA